MVFKTRELRLLSLAAFALIIIFAFYQFEPLSLHNPPWAARQTNASVPDASDNRAKALPNSAEQVIPPSPGNARLEDTSGQKVENAKPSGANDDVSKASSPAADESTHSSSSSPSSSRKRPDAGKVLMVTASSGHRGMLGVPHLKEQVYENRMTYANRYGYEFMWANISSYNLSHGEPIYWNKIPVLQEAFIRYPEVEWLWWMDIDIIIMNQSLSMWDHVLSPEGMARHAALDKVINKPGGGPSGWKTLPSYNYSEVNFMIASGGWGMNVGNFLMRRSYWSEWLLDLWIEPFYVEKFKVLPENDGWTHMYRHHPIVRRHTLCTNQRALNAYPAYNPLGEHYAPGDHSVHFAGCGSDEKCPGEWAKYWDLREEDEVPALVKQKLADGTAEIENVQRGIGLPAGANMDAVAR
ncbi:MAG: hypothetical protein LQ344_007092 [Seirophora lacunosa]|nr:MAG: hypothetical protein LQ344_007092 [Seirophora lacunosa]